MDESLKARLIGATVLVVVAVLLVPELLTGRKTRGPAADEPESAPGTRSFTIELGQGRSAGAVQSPARPAVAPVSASRSPPVRESPIAEPPASEPAGTGTAGSAAAPAAEPGEKVAAGIPGPAPAADPGVATTAAVPPAAAGTASATASGGWAVQVGAFGSAASADRIVRELGAAGFEARVVRVARGGHALHRVRVGHASDKAAAEQLARQLQARGLPGTVVADD
jgi:cell division septation protein DedD